MNTDTIALRLYGSRDLRLEHFRLPRPSDDEILAEIVCNGICMSSNKAARQGPAHKRVPDDVHENPVIIGHEFAGQLTSVGKRWQGQFREGQKFSIQPAMMYKGSLKAPGYSYPWIGGNSQRVVIPLEVMITGCLLPYEGDAFFNASLAEPVSCIVGAFRAQYHHAKPDDYAHEFGIKTGGNCALMAAAGPMGETAIDMALHGERRPSLLIVTDMDEERMSRVRKCYPVKEAKREGVDLIYLNPDRLPPGFDSTEEYVRHLTGGRMLDDVFVFFPNPGLVEEADALLGRDGCLNFFAGPAEKDFKAAVNFYNVHYERHHLVGTSGGNKEDMRIALKLIGEGTVKPDSMITHVGGLDSTADTIINLPDIGGGKKMVYTHLSMPMTSIYEFDIKADEHPEPLKSVFRELDALCKRHHGLWNKEAEDFLLSCDELELAPEPV